VDVGDLSNSSGPTSYSDYTDQVLVLSPGETYPVTITPGFDGGPWDEYFKIWVDYNRDGDFEDDGEQVFYEVAQDTVTGEFTVPMSALSGVSRMRVTMKYNSEPAPCETFEYGEVEDYGVYISSPPTADFKYKVMGILASFLDWSVDPDGWITSWEWDFGDGHYAYKQHAVHAYAGAGVYPVSLTVTDNEGYSDTVTKDITIVEEPGVVTLHNGLPLTNQVVGFGRWKFYRINVPPGAYRLEARLSGGIGDADLYTKYGSLPTLSDYDCISDNLGNNEVCVTPYPASGAHYLAVYTRGYVKGLTVLARFR
jgi:PKD repeat protein